MNPDTPDTWAISLSPQDRIHDSLNKDTPNSRPVENRPSPIAKVISRARRSGLHQKVRRRLGGSPSLDEPFPSKPKGMWWRTYEPLRETAERAEIRSSLLFSGLMARFPQRQSASMAVLFHSTGGPAGPGLDRQQSPLWCYEPSLEFPHRGRKVRQPGVVIKLRCQINRLPDFASSWVFLLHQDNLIGHFLDAVNGLVAGGSPLQTTSLGVNLEIHAGSRRQERTSRKRPHCKSQATSIHSLS
jgi:hypothetical protein